MNPLYILVGAYLLLGGKWETPAFLQKKPQTAQLAAAQDELVKAKAAQAKAEAELAKANAERDARLKEQLDYTQQMVLGTDLALSKIPADQRIPEVKLAAEFSGRAVAGFEAARGRLTPEQRKEIEGLFSEAMKAKDAEVETLRTALRQKDADLATATTAKAALEKRIPVLEAEVQTKVAEVTAKDATVQAKTKEVALYADTVAAEKARAGSLDALAGNLVRGIIGALALYLLIHFALPSLAQEFPGVSWLQGLNKAAKSVSSAHL